MDYSSKLILLDINDNARTPNNVSYIERAVFEAEIEIEKFEEDINSIKDLKPSCDKTDYILAGCSGALCGILDVFLVDKPGESPLGNITDKGFAQGTMWFAKEKTILFAKISGWKPVGEPKLNNAITWLENHYKVPYDQTTVGEAIRWILGVNTDASSHHFESLGHNPTLLGLFFSILDQFTNTSHFVLDGQLVTLYQEDNKFTLKGNNFVSKLFCGFCNWFGHLISDISGSHNSAIKGSRGMGIPSPIWAWINDILVIRRKLCIEESEFDITINKLAVKIFNEGFDMRFQTTQAIPVLINELVVRLFYSIRSAIQYYNDTPKGQRSFTALWSACKPYGNPSVSRMLTVAHGTFCMLDLGDATVRSLIAGGGQFNPLEFCLRINLAGIGRFAISLYGEGKRNFTYYQAEKHAELTDKRKSIAQNYLEGLNDLKHLYDDENYLTFADDIVKHNYQTAFQKTINLAELRGATPVKNKTEIDSYFSKNKK